jgi:DNA-binding MarR family transcriptional regulator
MGVEFGGNRGSSAGSAYKTWSLTQNGQMRVDAIAGRGTEGRVLEALRSEGSASIPDIVRNTGLTYQNVKTVLDIAKAKGYAAPIN